MLAHLYQSKYADFKYFIIPEIHIIWRQNQLPLADDSQRFPAKNNAKD
jgi:hypothetical protein